MLPAGERAAIAAPDPRITRVGTKGILSSSFDLSILIDPAVACGPIEYGQAAGEAHNAAYAPEHTFWFGLQRILDGIEALVRSRPSDG